MQRPDASGYPAHILFAKRLVRPLLKTSDPYVSPSYLQDFHVKCRRFDLYTGATFDPRTGKPDPSARVFTQPISEKSMERAVNATRPWVTDIDDNRTLHWDEDLDDWWHAFQIGNHLDTYLVNNYNQNLPGLLGGTGWQEKR